MKYRSMLAVVIGLGAVSLAGGAARAGDLWAGYGCGGCSNGYASSGQVFYAQPTYAYAPATVTIVPRVIVQPNYFVERTYVVNESHYVSERAPCWLGCEPHRLVNQGQFPIRRIEAQPGRWAEPYPTDVFARRHGAYTPNRRLWVERTYRRPRHTAYRLDARMRSGYRSGRYPSGRVDYPIHRH
jgi:hypothetical protein